MGLTTCRSDPCRTGGVSRALGVRLLGFQVGKSANAHTDPELRYSRAEFPRLVRKLLEIGMCDLTLFPKATFTLFVARKD